MRVGSRGVKDLQIASRVMWLMANNQLALCGVTYSGLRGGRNIDNHGGWQEGYIPGGGKKNRCGGMGLKCSRRRMGDATQQTHCGLLRL